MDCADSDDIALPSDDESIQELYDIMAVKIQQSARRFLARLRMRRLKSLRDKKIEVLKSLREMYLEVWTIPDTVPEDTHDKFIDRMIERDVFGDDFMKENGPPALTEVQCARSCHPLAHTVCRK